MSVVCGQEYELLASIGKGGFAVVYHARFQGLDVAIKMVSIMNDARVH